MSKARLVITAVTIEHRSVREVAHAYGVSRSWIYELLTRYRTEGDAAFEPRSRQPHTRPQATPANIAELILNVRRELTANGLDAGADTIGWHLRHHHHTTVSRATIYRTIRTAGLVTPAPEKRPKSSYIRFQAEQPNETWQSDFTHWRLADNTDIEILTWLDDHSRYALSVTCHKPVTGQAVTTTFTTATRTYGIPFSTLTDNGMVFTARFAQGGRTSRNGLENLLVQLNVRQKNSRPNHPTTCGKVERFQQTMKKWLTTHPRANTLAELQQQLDTFVQIYNQQRPHRSLPNRSTPAVAYQARPKATPTGTAPDIESRVRHDKVSSGSVTLRVDGKLHHIGLGQPLNRTPIIMLIHAYDIRVIHAATGELLRQLTINPNHLYHGTGKQKGGPSRPYGPQKNKRPKP